MVDVTIGKFTIKAPAHHLISQFMDDQPYRYLPVGISAGAVASKYPDASFLDIGANIGDTAAMMASHAANPLILVEASDYYHEILTKNARAIPNVRRIEFVFVSTDDSPLTGRLHHWGGTAAFEAGGEQPVGVTKRLSEVADTDTKFVKMDTDGLDFAILGSSAPWLSDSQPLLLFESDVSTAELYAQAQEAFSVLREAGYRWFIVWDDRGYHITTTDDFGVVEHLHLWLHKHRTARASPNAVYYFDILCAASADREIAEVVTRTYTAMP